MAADAAALAGIPLAELPVAVRDTLDRALPVTWSRANPVDIIGDAPVRRYTDTLQTLLADPATGAVLFAHAPTAIVRSDDIARACAPLVRQAPGRVMACWLGSAAVADARRIFEEAGAANYATPEEAVHAFGMLRTYRRNQALLTEAPTAAENSPPDREAARKLVAHALAEGREMLDEAQAKALLRAYGIPVVPTVPVGASAAEAIEAARQCGFPVALKILSPDISHKSDVGGVKLGLRDENELRRAVDEMLDRVRQFKPEARVQGFTVQPMVRRPMAQELIVGASVDPVFGPVLLFGQGGTAVEVLADRAIGLPPLNRVLARELIASTRVSRLLAGYRDRPPARLEAISDVLIALSEMLADLPALAELDINPLWADHEGVMALDARVRLSPAPVAGAERFAIVPYPAALTEKVTWDGREVLLRPIRPEDEAQQREFMSRIEPEDLRLRFFSSRRDLPRSELARLVQIDYAREMAFVALAQAPDGTTETLGAVHALADPDNIEAEFAIIVRSDLKGRGLGHLLLDKLIRYQRAHGTQRLVGHVLRENEAMNDLARTQGFRIDRAGSDTTSVRQVLELQGER
jgi:acetyltransferase